MTEAHPHDHLFRAVFGSPENTLGILETVLPPALASEIEPASPTAAMPVNEHAEAYESGLGVAKDPARAAELRAQKPAEKPPEPKRRASDEDD